MREKADTSARSSRAEVRNPLLALPEIREAFASLPADSQTALRIALKAMSVNFRARGNEAWQKHKPPMAAYWKGNAVYARHLALAIRQNGGADPIEPTGICAACGDGPEEGSHKHDA
ncbi:hypothetical protein LJR039_007249 [Pseudorhodoferax sp. LjRoot39]|uniref:hypothetical protein n=1 Tax=Pseudorhodoferax sp. LjRoot39 TaxID=3342328 RepID=UPI003ECF7916